MPDYHDYTGLSPSRVARLKWLLRVLGCIGVAASPWVIMPDAWLDAFNQPLGLQSLPRTPVVLFLARNDAAMYTALGTLYWYLSFDPERWRPIIRFMGGVAVVFGAVALSIDLRSRLPWWWIAIDGPAEIAIGLTLLGLTRDRVPKA